MKYVNRQPCADCGSIRQRVKRTGTTDQDQVLRLRQCDDCGHRFTTVEVVVTGATLWQLDVGHRFVKRMQTRARRGYHGTRSGSYPRSQAAIDVTVKVRSITPEEKAA
jgi:DNA-directed RNA polymerase subunit RPC12/RpoP